MSFTVSNIPSCPGTRPNVKAGPDDISFPAVTYDLVKGKAHPDPRYAPAPGAGFGPPYNPTINHPGGGSSYSPPAPPPPDWEQIVNDRANTPAERPSSPSFDDVIRPYWDDANDPSNDIHVDVDDDGSDSTFTPGHDPATRPYSPIGIWEGSGDELVDLYHGTSRQSADAITANGIDVTRGDWDSDFGRGFYLTNQLNQAISWAEKGHGDDAAILHYRVPKSVLRAMNGKTFPGANAEYIRLVYKARSQRGPPLVHNYDYVEGPLMLHPEDFLAGRQFLTGGHQISFHQQDTASELDEYRVGVS